MVPHEEDVCNDDSKADPVTDEVPVVAATCTSTPKAAPAVVQHPAPPIVVQHRAPPAVVQSPAAHVVSAQNIDINNGQVIIVEEVKMLPMLEVDIDEPSLIWDVLGAPHCRGRRCGYPQPRKQSPYLEALMRNNGQVKEEVLFLTMKKPLSPLFLF